MNIDSGDTPLVLLCPAWKTWGTVRTVKPKTTILHSRADETVPFEDTPGHVSRTDIEPLRSTGSFKTVDLSEGEEE